MPTDATVVCLPPGGSELTFQDIVLDDPRPHEVVVRQQASGVCHSQLGHIANADPSEPLLLGHEAFGEVVAVGSEVDHVVVNDSVFVTWIPRSGQRRPERVTVPMSGGMRVSPRNVFTWGTHSVVDEQFVVKAPHGFPADVGSIIGCAVMTGAGAVINSAQVVAGQSVAVWGVGGVGLAAVAAARIAGATPIIAVDIDPAKLKLARLMGADHVVDARSVDAVAAVRELTAGRDGIAGVDFSLDCTGRVDNVAASLAAVRPGVPGGRSGGADVLVSVIRGAIEVSGMDLVNGQKQVLGCLGGGSTPDRDFPAIVEWYLNSQLDLDALITDHYPLEAVNEALDDLRHGRVLGRAVLDIA